MRAVEVAARVIMGRRLLARAAAFALLLAVAPLAGGRTRADCESRYKAERGQEGKDVIWVPTEDAMVVRMLEMAHVTSADKVYDLGSGDGKIPIAAAKRFGATAVGIEYDRGLVKLARCLAEAEGVRKRVEMIQGDIFEADFSAATVVTLYLLPALNLQLRPTLLAMKAGTRIVSYSFTMGDWQPDDFVDTDEGSAYLWIVPANVAGEWTFRGDDQSFAVTLEQTFQRLTGSASGAAVAGKLGGEQLAFAFMQGGEEVRVAATVDGDRLSATVTRAGQAAQYTGTRK
jgi:SAM-dependent methyltransferase